MNIIKQLKEIERKKRLAKLTVLYDTGNADELVKEMQKDIKLIKKIQRKVAKREADAALLYSRIGSDRWNR